MKKCAILILILFFYSCSVKDNQKYWGDSFGKETEPFKCDATNTLGLQYWLLMDK